MNNDAKIKELLQKVQEQRSSLGEKPKTTWRTNGIFKFDDKTSLNINVASEMELANALALVLWKKDYHNEAFSILGLNPNEHMEILYNGFSISDYIEDFKTRISLIKWNQKKELLTNTEKKLQSLVSEEARTEMELDSISKLLG